MSDIEAVSEAEEGLSNEAILNLLIEKGLSGESAAARLLTGRPYNVTDVIIDMHNAGFSSDEYVNEASFVAAESVRAMPDTNSGNEASRFYKAMLSITDAQLIEAMRNVINASKETK